MKPLIFVILTLNLLCGCQPDSPAAGKTPEAEEAAGATGSPPPGQPAAAEIVSQTLELMRGDIRVFLQAGEYEAALMQIGHYRESINRLPTPTAEAIRFRDGELYYDEALCLLKAGKQGKAREALQAGLGRCPEEWRARAMKLLGSSGN